MVVLKRMPRKIDLGFAERPLLGTPHAPALDGPNGHGEALPGAYCVSDGKWVTFYKKGEEVWARNALYAAAHFDFAVVPTNCSATED